MQGESSRFISKYLKDEYDEYISYNTINNYRKNNDFYIKDKVISKVEKRYNCSEDNLVDETTDVLNNIVNITSDRLYSLLNVSSQFENDYELMKKEAQDPNSRISIKDVINMSYKANKLFLDFIKHKEIINEFQIKLNNNDNNNPLQKFIESLQDLLNEDDDEDDLNGIV